MGVKVTNWKRLGDIDDFSGLGSRKVRNLAFGGRCLYPDRVDKGLRLQTFDSKIANEDQDAEL